MLGLVLASPSRASEPVSLPTSIRDYDHVAWTQRDGAPPGIWAMAQSKDGWLWLGTSSGLFRFDGVSFERADLLPADSHRSRSIAFIAPMESGDLWAAYASGGASLRSARDPLHPTMPPGLPDGAVLDFIIDVGGGEVWTKNREFLYRFDGKAWRGFDPASVGFPPNSESLTPDQHGNLWVSSEGGLWVRRNGAQRFEPVVSGGGFSRSAVVSPTGGIWQRRDSGLAVIEAVEGSSGPASLISHSQIDLIDSGGAWWSISCAEGGVCRTARPKQPATLPMQALLARDSFDPKDGLTGLTMTMLRDREGNIWVGTKNGLDRFRPRALNAVTFPEPTLYFAMVPEPAGGLWLGTASMGFRDAWRRINDGRISIVPGLEPSTTTTYRDRDGSIVLGGPSGLWRFDGRTFQAIKIAPAQQGSRVQAISRDGHGRLWVAFRDFPVFEWNEGQWIAKGGIDRLPDLAPVRAVTDTRGRVWFGYLSNRVVILDGTHVTDLGEAEGLDTGTVTAILPENDTVLVGGEQGLSVFDGQRFIALRVARPELLKGVTGLLRTADGTLWINGIAGAVRIRADEFARALKTPGYRMAFRLFDTSDGMPGGAQQARPLPTIVETVDRRLWFAASNGMAWMDPSATPANTTPPPMAIRSFQSDGHGYPAVDGLQLPPAVRELRIGFSALQFAMPEKLTLRYRLEGYEQQWQEAGTRREAFYTNLPPGHYRFQVTAANEDGVWNAAPAMLSFDIAPAFHQTRWFIALAVAAALLALWLVYRMRLAQSRHKLRQEIEVRQVERERIARDLHDTLLQGVQGLLLRLQTWAADARVPSEQRSEMSAAAGQAREMLVEGRDRIIALRRSDTDRTGLAENLRGLGEDFASVHEASFSLTVTGEPRLPTVDVGEEILDIAREALRNAFAHSRAARIEARLFFSPGELVVEVLDDGCGIDADVLRDGGRAGHWGLSGMRERAARLGAALAVVPGESGGTHVTLRVPARIAFGRRGSWR